MAVSKRGRDEYSNGWLALPDAKRINGGLTLANDNDLMPSLEKIDNICSPEESDVGIKAVINSLDNEIGLKTQSDHNIDSTDEEEGSTDQMGSKKQGELNADRNSQLTSVTADIGDFTCYEDARAELDQFSPDELGIIMSYADGDSIPEIMYLDAVHSYADENREVFSGSLWEDDIWQLNEDPVIQNNFALPQPEEFGINGIEVHDVWK